LKWPQITEHQGRRVFVGSFFVHQLNAGIDMQSLSTRFGSGRKTDSVPQGPHFPRVWETVRRESSAVPAFRSANRSMVDVVFPGKP
jgi:hypothetical protein